MKAVQFTMDEGLLRRMDEDPEVKEHGRSAFVRRAIAAYLDRRREQTIRDAYRRGYGAKPLDGAELPPIEGQPWPDE